MGETFVKPVAYSVSKSAILNLTRYLATYWAKAGVRVNTLTLAGVWNDQPAEFLEAYAAARPAGADARRGRGARRGRLPRVGRLVVRHRLERRRRRRLVCLVVAERDSEPRRRSSRSGCVRAVAREAPSGGRDASVPGRSLRGGGRRRRRRRCARRSTSVGRAHRSRARRHRARARAPAARAARGGVGDRGGGDGKAARARPGRDRRRDRDGVVRGRRGAPLLRANDDGEHASSNRADRAPAARRRGADHELQHAASERRVEGVSGDLLRERGRA